MKRTFFLMLLVGSALLSNTCWATSSLAVLDTIPGQSQLVKQLESDACRQLEKGSSPAAVAGYTVTQAQAMLELAISTSIDKRREQIKAVVKRSGNGEDKLMAQLPTVLALQLVKNCTVARALYNRFQGNAALEAGETSFVQSFSAELCEQLNGLHTKGAFKGKTPEQRVELFHQVFLQSLKTRGPQIMQLYGPAGNSSQTVAALSTKVFQQMQQQCAESIMLLNNAK